VSKWEQVLLWTQQQRNGSRLEGRAETEEVSRQQMPNREMRPDREKVLFPDAGEVKRKAERDRYERGR
jgi:hypothetical protein